ncbi:MAG TPA: sigma factor-like helix-turn-helix DNA-binding protein [Phycisphaerae bacterium]|nr:sigma factor-like helix-turn-helix DNA-binding protein [Phycisphaerae bacterium]
MAPRKRATDDSQKLFGLANSKTRGREIRPRYLRKAWWLLPQRERVVLALLHRRGASLRELAGLLGVSRATVRRMARRAVRRATDPQNLAILASWRVLKPEEQRLAYLHRFLGMSLRRIAQLGLVGASPSTGGGATPKTLRAMLRRIRRKARRWGEAKRLQEGADVSPPPPDSDSSAG